MMKLEGKTALVTGAAGGLGKEFAGRLLRAGAKVCLADINENLGLETLSEFRERHGDGAVVFALCDVTKVESFRSAIRHALSAFDSPQLDVLVNNAGVMGEKEGWRRCVDVNFNGVLLGTTLAMEEGRMSNQHGGVGGAVVQVSSVLGLFASHRQPKGWAYNVSKSAVVTLSRCLGSSTSWQSSTGVRSLCLCPSVARTPILDGCSEEELARMRRDVGGIMDKEQVGDAFESLLSSNTPSGSVMVAWKDCPPFFVPDPGMATFVVCTACAMLYRYVPGFGRRCSSALGTSHMIAALTLMVLPWLLALWGWLY